MLKKATSIALCAAMLMANAFTPFTAKAAEVQEPAAEERAVERKADDGVFDASDISIQLYSIRSALNPLSGNYEGIKGELQKLSQMGYQNMEPYSRLGLTAEQWLQLEQESGLHISSWHQGASAAEDPAERDAANAETAAFFKKLGLKDVFINYGGFSTAGEYAAFMERIRAFREAMKAQGIGLNFHTHDHEFQQAEANGELAVSPLPIDEILAALDVPAGDPNIPEGHVAKLELDVHWAARAGYNPINLIKKYADRLTYLHMKDLSFTQMSWGTGNTFLYEELGEGTLDLSAIIKAGREAGVLYYVVEQDGNFVVSEGTEDPYASVRRSFNYLSNFFHSDLGDASLYLQEPVREAPVIRDDQLSIQLYTIRGLFNGLNGNYNGVKNVLQQVADIGIKNVELYSFHGLSGAQWKQMLEETGLHASSMHQGIVTNEADVKVLVKNLKEVGLDNIFYPNGAFNNYEGSVAALDQLDQFRKRMAKDGIKVNYHTHSQEYAQKVESDGRAGSRVVLDDIIEDGAEVELDVHWAARAGRNPVALIGAYADDVTYLHIKDLGYTYGRSFVYEEIGSGVLDMDAIIQAGNAAGVRYYVIEQDGNYLGNDPLASLRRSYEYIKEHYLVEVPASVSLSKTNVSMKVGEMLALGVATQPEGAAANALWSSSNSGVASVDENGQITAVSAGSAIVTCTVGELSAQCAVLVNAASSEIGAEQISLQLYTLRSLMSAGAGMPGTDDMDGRIAYVTDILKQVANIGYKNVEPYNTYGISAADWKKMAAEAGVKISSWHQGFSNAATAAERKTANEATAKFFEELGLGQIFINYGGFTAQETAEEFLGKMVEFREVMEDHNVRVGFHTHNHEFQQDTMENGELNAAQEDLILDRLLRALDSEKLNYKAELELDVHWAARAGRNPVDVIKKYQDRLTYLHMKDLSFTERNTFVYEELGDGTLDIPAIVQAGMEAGVKYYVVEQDSNWYLTNNAVSNAYDYMGSIKASFDYLRQFFGKDIKDIVPQKPQRSNPQIQESQLSVQLYSVRDRLSKVSGDYNGIKAVLKEISGIGYKNVEMYNFLGLTGVQWKKLLQETGLNVSSIHQNVLTSESQIKTLVRNLKGVGLDSIFIASGRYSDYETSIAFVEQMNAFSKRLAKDGIKVNYHTHNQEYTQRLAKNGYGEANERATADSHIVLDDIVASGMNLELDTHWAARAGRNPVDVIDAYADAATYLHIKDLGYAWGGTYVYEEIGSGQLNMDEIIMAGNAANIQYYVVEQDSNFVAEGSMASIKRSYDYIKAHYLVIPAKSVSLNRTSVSIKVGATSKLTATVAPADATDKSVTWISSNKAVAAVDGNGLVTGKKAGSAVITATANTGKVMASCKVTVTAPAPSVAVKSVTANMSLKVLKKGKKVTLKATVLPKNATDKKVAWKSSKPKVASVNNKGVVTAKGNGTAIITATAGKKKATVKIYVSNVTAVSKVSLNKNKATVKVKKSIALKASVLPAKAKYKGVTFQSSNTKVAKVSKNGKVTGVKAGKATITVITKEGGKKAKCVVTVKK